MTIRPKRLRLLIQLALASACPLAHATAPWMPSESVPEALQARAEADDAAQACADGVLATNGEEAFADACAAPAGHAARDLLLALAAAPGPVDGMDVIERAWHAGAFGDDAPAAAGDSPPADEPAPPAAGQVAAEEPAAGIAVPDWLPWICHAIDDDPACGGTATAQAPAAEGGRGAEAAEAHGGAEAAEGGRGAAAPEAHRGAEVAEGGRGAEAPATAQTPAAVTETALDDGAQAWRAVMAFDADEAIHPDAVPAAAAMTAARHAVAAAEPIEAQDERLWQLVDFLARERLATRGVDILLDEDPAPTQPASAEPHAGAAAASGAGDDSPFGVGALKVAAAELDELRGGFETPQGRFAFGFERAVYVNGQLFATQTLSLGDLSRLSGGQAGAATVVIQNGAGNVAALEGLSAGAAALVIQNSLNDQSIRTITTINASVPATSALRSLGQMRSISQGVIDAATRR